MARSEGNVRSSYSIASRTILLAGNDPLTRFTELGESTMLRTITVVRGP